MSPALSKPTGKVPGCLAFIATQNPRKSVACLSVLVRSTSYEENEMRGYISAFVTFFFSLTLIQKRTKNLKRQSSTSMSCPVPPLPPRGILKLADITYMFGATSAAISI
jgi:hypothetical protein